ncbi:hypothetical protein EJ06DRAFT_536191 [Trichodelitschia bisporula]|uniref:C2H2-type domain-containing protein n=1 Tax=Trichodelitschia bisporula TaxID=703511 RepID=A0A6G1I6E6_9PEZI|nr:hypothetical protein EJ06DRAFT_536191 [Trichodelitschia bisporula]
MAMVDNRQQQSSLLGSMPYDPPRYQIPAPQFTNPWGSSVSSAPSSHLYSSTSGLDGSSQAHQQQQQRPTSISMPSFSIPVTAASLGAGSSLPNGLFDLQNPIDTSQDILGGPRSYAPQFTTSGPQSYAPATTAGYSNDYASSSRGSFAYQQEASRRSSHPSVPSATSTLNEPFFDHRQRPNSMIDFSRLQATAQQRLDFGDAVDASRTILAMNQNDITPRNIYGSQNSGRSSTDSYGFPSTHSAHSSISSASTYPYYSGSVADSSVSDYSSASESVDLNSRTLPRPSTMMSNIPPAPQSMMGQFSSKVSSNTQKKHKCKVCDKRFTRPSSLQTHMYSHTGEKPYACEVEGCGRHFSVVSNLRRHKKVHKGEHDQPSPEEA